MKISLQDIRAKGLNVSITGSEDWLSELYETIKEMGGVSGSLQGELSVQVDEYSRVRVSGELGFSPKLPCGRCLELIDWPLKETIDQEFRQRPESFSREMDLSSEELDYYFFENSRIDLFELINDTILLSIPDPLILRNRENQCKLCNKDISDEQVAGDKTPLKDNPFAVLSSLKDKL